MVEVKQRTTYELSLFNPNSQKDNSHKVVIIILNRPLIKEKIVNLSKKADLIICADGGANRYYEAVGEK